MGRGRGRGIATEDKSEVTESLGRTFVLTDEGQRYALELRTSLECSVTDRFYALGNGNRYDILAALEGVLEYCFGAFVNVAATDSRGLCLSKYRVRVIRRAVVVCVVIFVVFYRIASGECIGLNAGERFGEDYGFKCRAARECVISDNVNAIGKYNAFECGAACKGVGLNSGYVRAVLKDQTCESRASCECAFTDSVNASRHGYRGDIGSLIERICTDRVIIGLGESYLALISDISDENSFAFICIEYEVTLDTYAAFTVVNGNRVERKRAVIAGHNVDRKLGAVDDLCKPYTAVERRAFYGCYLASYGDTREV